MISMTICGWLLTGIAVAVDGGEKPGSTVGAVKSRTFNVLSYGALGEVKKPAE